MANTDLVGAPKWVTLWNTPGAVKWLQQLHEHSSNTRLLIPTKYDTNTVLFRGVPKKYI